MVSHDVLLPKKPKRFPVGIDWRDEDLFPPPIARSGIPVRPRTWRPENPHPDTDYGEMQEDDDEWWPRSSSDVSVIDLSSESSQMAEESSSEPSSEAVEALADRIRNRSGIVVTRSHKTLTIKQTTQQRTLVTRHPIGQSQPSPTPEQPARIPKKSKK